MQVKSVIIVKVKGTGRTNVLSLVKKKASRNVKPVALAGPVPHVNPVAQAQELSKPFSTDYSLFVSLLQVPVKILRDTGASIVLFWRLFCLFLWRQIQEPVS